MRHINNIDDLNDEEFDRLRDIAPICYVQMVLQTLIQYLMKTHEQAALYDKDIADLLEAVDARLTKKEGKIDKTKLALIDKCIDCGMFAAISSRANCELDLVRNLGESIEQNNFYCNFNEEITELKEFYEPMDMTPTQKEIHKAFSGIKNQLYTLMAVKVDAKGTNKLIEGTMTGLIQKHDQEIMDMVSNIKLYRDILNELMYYMEEDYGIHEVGSVDDVLEVCDTLVADFDEKYHTDLSKRNLLDEDQIYEAADGLIMEIKNDPQRAYAWVIKYDMFDPYHTVQNFVEGKETIKLYS